MLSVQIRVDPDRDKPLLTNHQLWSSTFEGKPLVTRHKDVEQASCRALKAMGVTGRVEFVHESGTVGLRMDVETGAGLSTAESDRGLRVRAFRLFGDPQDPTD